MFWIKALPGSSRVTVYYEEPESYDLVVDALPDGFGALHLVNGMLVRHLPGAEPTQAKDTVWDEMAAAYKEGVQEA